MMTSPSQMAVWHREHLRDLLESIFGLSDTDRLREYVREMYEF